MNILLSAAACSPYHGSEPGVGWTVAKGYIQAGCKVTVMTYDLWKPEIDKASKDGIIPEGLSFVFIPVSPMPQGSSLKLKFWTWSIYKQYLKQVRVVAERLIKSTDFNYIHHVTVASWRVGVPLYGLGVPFVFGPVAGATTLPIRLFKGLSLKSKCFEFVRLISNVLTRYKLSVRRTIKNSDVVLASNEDEYQIFKGLRNGMRVHQLSNVSLSEDHIKRFTIACRSRKWEQTTKPLTIFYGGLVDGLKGIAYAIEAVADAKARGVELIYNIYATGSEVEHLKKLSAKLDIEGSVVFHQDMLRGNDYLNVLAQSDIFLMPSLRENCSITLLEAMLSGCVPIVANNGGPARVVNHESSGYVCSIHSHKSLVKAISDALHECYHDRERLHKMSIAASNSVVCKFPVKSYLDYIIATTKNFISKDKKITDDNE